MTLAVGMAKVFSSLPLMKDLMAYWYHFVIMFEALFILTLLETGTRVARFVFQETLAQFNPRYQLGHQVNWGVNVTMSIVVCGLWGGLLYIGNLDTLWRMLGIANQLLATIALAVGTTYLLLHAPKRSLRPVHGHSVRVRLRDDVYRGRRRASRCGGRSPRPTRRRSFSRSWPAFWRPSCSA